MASKIALAIAAGTEHTAGSPAPRAGSAGRSISSISIASGTSEKRRIGYDDQSRLVTAERSKVTSSLSARLIVWMVAPSI